MWDYSSKKNCMWAMVRGINLRIKNILDLPEMLST